MKGIISEVNLLPNYVFHLLALARVGFDSEYASNYSSSAELSDIEFLSQNKQYLTFGAGQGSDLVGAAVFYPLLFRLNADADLSDYYELLIACAATGDFNSLRTRYAEAIGSASATWFGLPEDELQVLTKHVPKLVELKRIFVTNFASYRDHVWPSESQRMQAVAARIEHAFHDMDVIGYWERVSGFEYAGDKFSVELCSAIKNGPNANSIDYERVVFYHDTPFEKLIQLITHEVGTHLLIDLVKQLGRDSEFGWSQLYGAYESLAMYFNAFIWGKTELAYELPPSFHHRDYLRLFDTIRSQSPVISPARLLTAGMRSRRNSD
jgi:hypothetical protein